LIEPIASPYLVPFEGGFKVERAATKPPKDAPGKREHKKLLDDATDALRDLQERLYAEDKWAVLLVFQAMDAAGKDSTIRAVMTGVNPAGCQVFSFKQPSEEALDHDFMWRIYKRLPERGRIGIFNRSHYEEVLVVRVHPEYLGAQKLPRQPELPTLWEERFESIRELERHLARNGTLILKFWLNVSRDAQKKRFLRRLDRPDKNWKFAARDLDERAVWPRYMEAYEAALNATSRPWAPWYAIPADDKPFMRYTVSRLIVDALERLDPKFPKLDDRERSELAELRRQLVDGG